MMRKGYLLPSSMSFFSSVRHLRCDEPLFSLLLNADEADHGAQEPLRPSPSFLLQHAGPVTEVVGESCSGKSAILYTAAADYLVSTCKLRRPGHEHGATLSTAGNAAETTPVVQVHQVCLFLDADGTFHFPTFLKALLSSLRRALPATAPAAAGPPAAASLEAALHDCLSRFILRRPASLQAIVQDLEAAAQSRDGTELDSLPLVWQKEGASTEGATAAAASTYGSSPSSSPPPSTPRFSVGHIGCLIIDSMSCCADFLPAAKTTLRIGGVTVSEDKARGLFSAGAGGAAAAAAGGADVGKRGSSSSSSSSSASLQRAGTILPTARPGNVAAGGAGSSTTPRAVGAEGDDLGQAMEQEGEAATAAAAGAASAADALYEEIPEEGIEGEKKKGGKGTAEEEEEEAGDLLSMSGRYSPAAVRELCARLEGAITRLITAEPHTAVTAARNVTERFQTSASMPHSSSTATFTSSSASSSSPPSSACCKVFWSCPLLLGVRSLQPAFHATLTEQRRQQQIPAELSMELGRLRQAAEEELLPGSGASSSSSSTASASADQTIPAMKGVLQLSSLHRGLDEPRLQRAVQAVQCFPVSSPAAVIPALIGTPLALQRGSTLQGQTGSLLSLLAGGGALAQEVVEKRLSTGSSGSSAGAGGQAFTSPHSLTTSHFGSTVSRQVWRSYIPANLRSLPTRCILCSRVGTLATLPAAAAAASDRVVPASSGSASASQLLQSLSALCSPGLTPPPSARGQVTVILLRSIAAKLPSAAGSRSGIAGPASGAAAGGVAGAGGWGAGGASSSSSSAAGGGGGGRSVSHAALSGAGEGTGEAVLVIG